MKKILIVEDEPIVADDIALSIEEMGYEVAGICDSGDQALQELSSSTPDLVLLDINLKGQKDGIQIAHEINSKYAIPFIFISSLFDNTTIQRAKNTLPAGYIVKPFKEADLRIHVELAFNKVRIEVDEIQRPVDDQNLFVRQNGAMVKLDFQSVRYVQADDNYSVFHTEKEKHVVSNTLKEIEERLVPAGFCRLHKTYLVNLSKIDRIEHSVVFVGEEMIPIGKVYRKAFFERLTVF